jgi:hypothetical protein
MKTNPHSSTFLLPVRIAIGLLVAGGAVAIGQSARAADAGEVTAVSSKVSDRYVRTKLADGSYRQETYAFGEGGYLGAAMRDETIDKLGFLKIAHVVAFPLAHQNYIPAKDPKSTNLLIMVYWGATDGASDISNSSPYLRLQASQVKSAPATSSIAPQAPPDVSMRDCYYSSNKMSDEVMAREVATEELNNSLVEAALDDRERIQADVRIAMLLGYDAELAATKGLEGTPLRHSRDDLVSEIEDSRYFVVLMAYDFQMARQHRKPELLWVTRISVRARGNDFRKVLPAMTEYASPYFGQDSHGLLRKPMPEGRIDVGEPKSLGFVTK